MTLLDWCLLLVWLGLTLCGFWKGAIRLVFGIGGAVVGLWLSLITGADLAVLLAPYTGQSWFTTVASYLLPFTLCLVLCVAAGWGLERTITALGIGWLNRLLGAMLAGLAAAILLTVLLMTACQVSPAWASLCSRSLLAPHLLSLLDLLTAPPGG